MNKFSKELVQGLKEACSFAEGDQGEITRQVEVKSHRVCS